MVERSRIQVDISRDATLVQSPVVTKVKQCSSLLSHDGSSNQVVYKMVFAVTAIEKVPRIETNDTLF